MLEAEGARERAEQREAAETRLRVRAEEERLAARRGGDGGPGLQTIIYPEQIDDLLAAGMARDSPLCLSRSGIGLQGPTRTRPYRVTSSAYRWVAARWWAAEVTLGVKCADG
jgi:hypothetical protein